MLPPPYFRPLLFVFTATLVPAQTAIVWDGSSSTLWQSPNNWTPALAPNAAPNGNNAQITDASPMSGATSGLAFAASSIRMDSAPSSGSTPNEFALTGLGSSTTVFQFSAATDSVLVAAGTLSLTASSATVTLTAPVISISSRSGLARELATLAVSHIGSSTITDLSVGDGVNPAYLNVSDSVLTQSGTLAAQRYSVITATSSTLSAVTGNLDGSVTATDSLLSFNTLGLGAHADVALAGSRVWLGATPTIAGGGQFHGTALFMGPAAAASLASFTTTGTFSSNLPLAVANGTSYVLSDGPAVLGSTLTLSSGFISSSAGDIAILSAPNGVSLPVGHALAGTGLIYGAVADETGGAGLASLLSQWQIDYAFSAGSDAIAVLGSPIFAHGLEVAGGTLAMLGPAQYFVQGTGLSGHGTVGGPVQISSATGNPLTLDGDLTLGTNGAGTVGLQGGRTYEIGAHALTLADGAWITGGGAGNFQLAGGRVIAGGNGLLPQNAGLVTLSGRGLLIDKLPNRFQPTDIALSPDAALALTDNLAIGSGLAVFASNASVNLGPSTTIAGGVMLSPAGFILAGSDTLSGYGLVHGNVTDETGGAGGLVASGTFNGGDTIFGLGAGTTRVLSAGEAAFTFNDNDRAAALTLVAPNGVSLLRDSLTAASSAALTVQGNLDWRGGDLPGTLTVSGNLTGQGLFVAGATNVGGIFQGSGFFGGPFSAGTVIPAGAITPGEFVQASGANTRLIAAGITTTSHDITLNGGTLTADYGLRFASDTNLRGSGTFTGYASGGNGGITGLTGNLTVDARGADGTVNFYFVNTYEVFDHTYAAVTLSILADTAVTLTVLDVSPGATFSTSQGATAGQALIGFNAPGGDNTSMIRGALTAGELRVYNRGDFDSVSADSGFLLLPSVARGAAVLGANAGNFDLGAGAAVTFGAAGGLTVPAGGNLAVNSSDARIIGPVQLDGTTSGSALSVAGLVTGSGNFGGDVILLSSGQARDFADALVVDIAAGGINPGRVGEAGLLTFSHDLTLAGNSTMSFELGGLTRGAGYDAIDIGGTLNFGGTLEIVFIEGFSVHGGEAFHLLQWEGATSAYTTLNLPGLASGLSWDATALPTSGVLSVAGTAAVPEISTTVALLGAAALASAAWVRNRGRTKHHKDTKPRS